MIWEGRLASATITAGRAAPVSCSPEDLPGGVPSGGRNSMARARVSPSLSILVGFPLRHTAGRAELRRFRRNPAPRWRNACLGNVGRARATRWCFSGFVSVPLKALCGGPRADSSQIRRHVGGTRVWATWAGRALLLCVLFLGLFPCSLAGLVRRALRRFRSDPAPRWRNASWANVGLARASRSAFRACFPCPPRGGRAAM